MAHVAPVFPGEVRLQLTLRSAMLDLPRCYDFFHPQ